MCILVSVDEIISNILASEAILNSYNYYGLIKRSLLV